MLEKSKNFYTTKEHQTDHTQFGGKIDIEDFNTYFPNKNRIHNQMEAIQLQTKLIHKNKQEKEKQKYRSMTMEELKELRMISNTNGRPSSTLTDEKWQQEFYLRKMFVTPYKENVKQLGGKFSQESGTWNEETMGKYYGQTNWQEYCAYINDILHNIRGGQVDYCYYIYQIMDLTKFHYSTLRTKYCDGYWEVWLEK